MAKYIDLSAHVNLSLDEILGKDAKSVDNKDSKKGGESNGYKSRTQTNRDRGAV